MFKRTNKIWKVVALALALCMLPVAALADASAVTITTSAGAAAARYNTDGSIMIAGASKNEAVRRLVVRESVAVPGPAVTPVWYNGAGEKLTLMLSKVTGADAEAWYSAIDSFKINNVEIPADKRHPNESYTEIVMDAVEGVEAPITSVVITDTEGEYSAVDTGTINVSKINKPAGKIIVEYPADADYFVAGTSLSTGIRAQNANAFGDAWEAALVAGTATVTFNGNAVVEYTYDAKRKALVLSLAIANDVSEATGTLTIAVDGYEDTVEEAIKVKAPTTLDAAILEAKTLTPVDTNGGEEEVNDAYHVVLPTATYGSDVAWSVSVDGAAYTEATVTEGKYVLTRPVADGASESMTHTLKATITKAGSKTETVDFEPVEIKKLGIPAFGVISFVEILKGEVTIAGTEVPYADAFTLTAKYVGADNIEADYVWTIGETIVSTESTYVPTKVDITKTITVAATPNAPFAGETVSAAVTIVLDDAYAPAPTVAFKTTKLTADGTAAAVVTVDETYKDAPGYIVGEPIYTYYEILAADADSEEAAIEKVKAGMEAKKDAKYATAGRYAVVKAAITYSIAGKDFGTIEVYDGLVVSRKTGGGNIGGGTLSAGTKPDEPAGDNSVSGGSIANGAAAFTDLDKATYAWAYDSIDALAKAGVFKGMTPTTFGPELTTTNAQVIALAVRIAGLKADDAKTDRVAADHWVYAEMAVAEANDILGVFGDEIVVDEETTREVAFTLLYNALKVAGIALPETAEAIEYMDASSINVACVEAITALTKAGIVNGMGDGTLAPKATITRAQLAKILGLAKACI